MVNSALLINLLGFSIGIALYGLLLVMVVRHRRDGFDSLLLPTSILGLTWNIGEFVVFVLKDFGGGTVPPLVLAVSYSALGFLPPVVVHSTWNSAETGRVRLFYLTVAAYAVASVAAAINFGSAVTTGEVPSRFALRILTFGAIALMIGLLALAFRQALEKKAVWVAALLIFAVSTLHFGSHTDQSSWPVEMVAHQSSLPLAFAILLQDYRFALADLFVKRALSLMMLALVAFGLYIWIAVPLLAWHETHDRNDVQAAVIVIGLWIATALLYPKLHSLAEWLVDSIVLRRTDFKRLRFEIEGELERAEDAASVLDSVSRRLAAALDASAVSWREVEDAEALLPAVGFEARRAAVFVATVERPQFEIKLDDFGGGRNLLSGEISMLRDVAMLAARRIDAIRVTHERWEAEIREQEFSRLAAEAQLSALRAQVNPHFLFNALTTVGHLIQSSPDKAFDTLMRLTKLLRRVLRSTGEFSTIGDELRLIENYLDIEKARFEERLTVSVEVPDDLAQVRIPSLILQPIVENSIKHAVSVNRAGGTISIRAAESGGTVMIMIADSGSGKPSAGYSREGGVGLENIRERLKSYYGKRAGLEIRPVPGIGTEVSITIPKSGAARQAA